MFDVLSDLGRRAAEALRPLVANAPEELPIAKSPRLEFGDYQIAACLALAKAAKLPPRDLAHAVAHALAEHPCVRHVDVAGPGFVNLFLSDGWIATKVSERMDDPRLGLRALGQGQRVVVDFSSPNVAKPMHIAHIRSTILGDCLVRTLRALAFDVIADNHLGDWGTQFGKLIVAYRRWLDPDAYAADAVGELLRLYAKFVATEKEERQALGHGAPDDDDDPVHDGKAPPILMEARSELVKLQKGDADNLALWRKFIDDSRHAFEQVYTRLGIRFDYWLGESAYNGLLPVVIDELRRREIAVESEGALVVTFEPKDKLPPFLVRKSDGGYNYATTDLATIAVRTGLFSARRILYVTDERQQLHFKQLFATAARMGVEANLEHVWFGLMRMPEGTIKTRDGNVIHLSSLLDEAERRAAELARAVLADRGSDLSEAEILEVGRVVGLGALKYNDLSKDRQTLVTFTWEKALSLDGNTAPFLQYQYARVRSILRKGELSVSRAEVLLGSPSERSLALRILSYPDVVEQVARTAKPHLLCDYLFELAQSFSSFYADHPVLKAEPDIRASRLVLTELVARVLAHGLGLLGIETLERM